jgi:hypothetical protein
MGCGNTEHRDLKARVLRAALIAILPTGEHVLHWDGSLKGLAIPSPRVWAKMLSCRLLSITAAFVLCCDVNHQCQAMSEPRVEPLWYGEQPNVIVRQLNLCNIFILKKKFKALKTLLHTRSAQCTITRKRVFLFPCLDKATGGLYLPSRAELWCTLQLRGQRHSRCFPSPLKPLRAVLRQLLVQL